MSSYLIAYDVAEDKNRAAIMRRLEKAGRRVQKSVFLVERANIEHLERELQKMLAESDSLLVIPLCGHCFANARFYGKLPPLLIFT